MNIDAKTAKTKAKTIIDELEPHDETLVLLKWNQESGETVMYVVGAALHIENAEGLLEWASECLAQGKNEEGLINAVATDDNEKPDKSPESSLSPPKAKKFAN
jgi:hypothetical protein